MTGHNSGGNLVLLYLVTDLFVNRISWTNVPYFTIEVSYFIQLFYGHYHNQVRMHACVMVVWRV